MLHFSYLKDTVSDSGCIYSFNMNVIVINSVMNTGKSLLFYRYLRCPFSHVEFMMAVHSAFRLGTLLDVGGVRIIVPPKRTV